MVINTGIPSTTIRINESDEGLIISRQALHRMFESVRLHSSFANGDDAIIFLEDLELDPSGRKMIVTNVSARFHGVFASAESLTISITDACSVYLSVETAWLPASPDSSIIELRVSTLILSQQPSDRSIELARVVKRHNGLQLDRDFVPRTQSMDCDPNSRRVWSELAALARVSLPLAIPLLEDRHNSWLRVLPVLRMAASCYAGCSSALQHALDKVLLCCDQGYRPAGFLRAFRQHLLGALPEIHKVKFRPSGELSLQLVRSLQVSNPARTSDGFCWQVKGQVNDGEWIIVRFDDLEEGQYSATFSIGGRESVASVTSGLPVVVSRGTLSATGTLKIVNKQEREPTVQIASYIKA